MAAPKDEAEFKERQTLLPIALQISTRFIRHVYMRYGRMPNRWCVSRQRFDALVAEMENYEKLTGFPCRSAPIERPNVLINGIPVVTR